MALENTSLISVAELLAHIRGAGSAQQENLELACSVATQAIEARLRRQLVSRGEFTEYHTLRPGDTFPELYVSEWPIVSIASLHEDTAWPRAYGAESLLVLGTDYEIVRPDRIRRLAGGGWPGWWRWGTRVVRNVMTAGYRGQDGNPSQALPVPASLKQAALFVAASVFKEGDRQRWGLSSVQDPTGNIQRFLGYFTPAIDELLTTYRRVEFHRTWEAA